jgi:hypothetical protein
VLYAKVCTLKFKYQEGFIMLHPKKKKLFIGVDVHKRTHTAVIINCFTEKLGELGLRITSGALNSLLPTSKPLSKGVFPHVSDLKTAQATAGILLVTF